VKVGAGCGQAHGKRAGLQSGGLKENVKDLQKTGEEKQNGQQETQSKSSEEKKTVQGGRHQGDYMGQKRPLLSKGGAPSLNFFKRNKTRKRGGKGIEGKKKSRSLQKLGLPRLGAKKKKKKRVTQNKGKTHSAGRESPWGERGCVENKKEKRWGTTTKKIRRKRERKTLIDPGEKNQMSTPEASKSSEKRPNQKVKRRIQKTVGRRPNFQKKKVVGKKPRQENFD